MKEYVDNMLKEFLVKFMDNRKVTLPANNDLFKEDTSKKLTEQEQEVFHRTVVKALFLCKRGRPDIHMAVAVLCSRVRNPGRQEWTKLV